MGNFWGWVALIVLCVFLGPLGVVILIIVAVTHTKSLDEKRQRMRADAMAKNEAMAAELQRELDKEAAFKPGFPGTKPAGEESAEGPPA